MRAHKQTLLGRLRQILFVGRHGLVFFGTLGGTGMDERGAEQSWTFGSGSECFRFKLRGTTFSKDSLLFMLGVHPVI